MVSVVSEATELVVTLKVAEVELAATVTLAGACAAALLVLERLTTAPAAGAGPLRVTVPTEEAPAGTAEGFKLIEVRVGGVTVRLAPWVAPNVPEMDSVVLVPTGLVVTAKVTEVALAGTVTLDGVCATAGLLLDRSIKAPPAGAGPLSVTVPVDELPP